MRGGGDRLHSAQSGVRGLFRGLGRSTPSGLAKDSVKGIGDASSSRSFFVRSCASMMSRSIARSRSLFPSSVARMTLLVFSVLMSMRSSCGGLRDKGARLRLRRRECSRNAEDDQIRAGNAQALTPIRTKSEIWPSPRLLASDSRRNSAGALNTIDCTHHRLPILASDRSGAEQKRHPRSARSKHRQA